MNDDNCKIIVQSTSNVYNSFSELVYNSEKYNIDPMNSDYKELQQEYDLKFSS